MINKKACNRLQAFRILVGMAVKRGGIIINIKANPAIKVVNQQRLLLASLAVKLRLCPSTWLRASSAKLRKASSSGVSVGGQV